MASETDRRQFLEAFGLGGGLATMVDTPYAAARAAAHDRWDTPELVRSFPWLSARDVFDGYANACLSYLPQLSSSFAAPTPNPVAKALVQAQALALADLLLALQLKLLYALEPRARPRDEART